MLVDELNEQKRLQATWFDEEIDREWEIERPCGAPALHRWLTEEKFRRSIASLPPLTGATALAVCAGSGMDAEFLARAGFDVTAVDISPRAVERMRERARRHEVAFTPIVADVERLPFADRSFDLVYVHDGLHHLDDPMSGLREMARVSRRAISVNEPADAAGTAVAIRLGLALEREDAGNRVARLRPDAVAEALERAGFSVACISRYIMVYRHEAGPVTRMFSQRGTMAVYRGVFRLIDRTIGQIGNKLTVQAVRA